MGCGLQMDEKGAFRQEPAPFHALLEPHRSLSPRGFLLLMLAIAGVSFVTGLVFFRMGAWPVTGFFGLDVAAIFAAFKFNYRDARAYESIVIDKGELVFTAVDAKGRRQEHVFFASWVRVLIDEVHDGTTRLKLALHGREIYFGGFLTNDERRELAHELKGALIAASGGPRI